MITVLWFPDFQERSILSRTQFRRLQTPRWQVPAPRSELHLLVQKDKPGGRLLGRAICKQVIAVTLHVSKTGRGGIHWDSEDVASPITANLDGFAATCGFDNFERLVAFWGDITASAPPVFIPLQCIAWRNFSPVRPLPEPGDPA